MKNTFKQSPSKETNFVEIFKSAKISDIVKDSLFLVVMFSVTIILLTYFE